MLPVRRAPIEGPPASAIGKLKGEMIAHTPYGLKTDRLSSAGDN